MKLKVDLRTVFKTEEAVNNIIRQKLEVPLSLGAKLMDLKGVLSEYTEYTVKQLKSHIPNLVDNPSNLSDVEKTVYNFILNTVIEIEVPEFESDELERCTNVCLDMEDIMLLMNLCTHKNNQAVDG